MSSNNSIGSIHVNQVLLWAKPRDQAEIKKLMQDKENIGSVTGRLRSASSYSEKTDRIKLISTDGKVALIAAEKLSPEETEQVKNGTYKLGFFDSMKFFLLEVIDENQNSTYMKVNTNSFFERMRLSKKEKNRLNQSLSKGDGQAVTNAIEQFKREHLFRDFPLMPIASEAASSEIERPPSQESEPEVPTPSLPPSFARENVTPPIKETEPSALPAPLAQESPEIPPSTEELPSQNENPPDADESRPPSITQVIQEPTPVVEELPLQPLDVTNPKEIVDEGITQGDAAQKDTAQEDITEEITLPFGEPLPVTLPIEEPTSQQSIDRTQPPPSPDSTPPTPPPSPATPSSPKARQRAKSVPDLNLTAPKPPSPERRKSVDFGKNTKAPFKPLEMPFEEDRLVIFEAQTQPPSREQTPVPEEIEPQALEAEEPIHQQPIDRAQSHEPIDVEPKQLETEEPITQKPIDRSQTPEDELLKSEEAPIQPTQAVEQDAHVELETQETPVENRPITPLGIKEEPSQEPVSQTPEPEPLTQPTQTSNKDDHSIVAKEFVDSVIAEVLNGQQETPAQQDIPETVTEEPSSPIDLQDQRPETPQSFRGRANSVSEEETPLTQASSKQTTPRLPRSKSTGDLGKLLNAEIDIEKLREPIDVPKRSKPPIAQKELAVEEPKISEPKARENPPLPASDVQPVKEEPPVEGEMPIAARIEEEPKISELEETPSAIAVDVKPVKEEPIAAEPSPAQIQESQNHRVRQALMGRGSAHKEAIADIVNAAEKLLESHDAKQLLAKHNSRVWQKNLLSTGFSRANDHLKKLQALKTQAEKAPLGLADKQKLQSHLTAILKEIDIALKASNILTKQDAEAKKLSPVFNDWEKARSFAAILKEANLATLKNNKEHDALIATFVLKLMQDEEPTLEMFAAEADALIERSQSFLMEHVVDGIHFPGVVWARSHVAEMFDENGNFKDFSEVKMHLKEILKLVEGSLVNAKLGDWEEGTLDYQSAPHSPDSPAYEINRLRLRLHTYLETLKHFTPPDEVEAVSTKVKTPTPAPQQKTSQVEVPVAEEPASEPTKVEIDTPASPPDSDIPQPTDSGTALPIDDQTQAAGPSTISMDAKEAPSQNLELDIGRPLIDAIQTLLIIDKSLNLTPFQLQEELAQLNQWEDWLSRPDEKIENFQSFIEYIEKFLIDYKYGTVLDDGTVSLDPNHVPEKYMEELKQNMMQAHHHLGALVAAAEFDRLITQAPSLKLSDEEKQSGDLFDAIVAMDPALSDPTLTDADIEKQLAAQFDQLVNQLAHIPKEEAAPVDNAAAATTKADSSLPIDLPQTPPITKKGRMLRTTIKIAAPALIVIGGILAIKTYAPPLVAGTRAEHAVAHFVSIDFSAPARGLFNLLQAHVPPLLSAGKTMGGRAIVYLGDLGKLTLPMI